MGQAVNTFLANHIETVSKVGSRVSKRTRNRRMTDALILMVILAAAATCFSFYWRTQTQLSAAQVKNQVFADKVEALKIQSDKLEQEIQQLKSDPKAIEDYARHQMGFVRTGDVVVKIEKETTEQAVLLENHSSVSLLRR